MSTDGNCLSMISAAFRPKYLGIGHSFIHLRLNGSLPPSTATMPAWFLTTVVATITKGFGMLLPTCRLSNGSESLY